MWPGGTLDYRRIPTRHPTDRDEEMTMDPQLIEWGPAHLRDEATVVDVEPQDPPDDN
jgi:hypothetical protein